MSEPDIQIIQSISRLGRTFSAWLVDVWGVIHNGVAPFELAVTACQRHRQSGGIVVLITNAPRPASAVLQQLDRIGVARDAFDGIVTSGDVARDLVIQSKDRAIYHLGPERDLPLFADLGITFVPATEAGVVVCTGLFDDEAETPEDYAASLDDFRRAGAVMICANPDVTVERGSRLVYCAGALGQAYGALGGEVLYAGKPHAPIYDLAKRMISSIAGRPVGRSELLAIGDGVLTDIKGAHDQGIHSIYIASAVSLKGPDLTPEALARTFDGVEGRPLAAMPRLSW